LLSVPESSWKRGRGSRSAAISRENAKGARGGTPGSFSSCKLSKKQSSAVRSTPGRCGGKHIRGKRAELPYLANFPTRHGKRETLGGAACRKREENSRGELSTRVWQKMEQRDAKAQAGRGLHQQHAHRKKKIAPLRRLREARP